MDVDTSFPYEDQVRVTVTSTEGMPLYLRIPGWATNATVNGAATTNGTMFKIDCKAGATKVVLDLNPEVRLETWFNGAKSVHRGALLYSLPLQADYKVLAHHFGDADMSNDYAATTSAKWNMALDADEANPSSTLGFASTGYVTGSAPFNHSNWPSHISASVREVLSSVTLNPNLNPKP